MDNGPSPPGPIGVRILLVAVALLTGVVVAQTAGILAVISGSSVAAAFVTAGVAFAGSTTLSLAILKALRLL